MVSNVTIKMESAPASQTFLATNVNNVLMDSINFQTVKVGFCYQFSEMDSMGFQTVEVGCQYFLNSYSYTKISINLLIYRMQL